MHTSNELKQEIIVEDEEDCLEPKSEPQDFRTENLLNFKQEYGSDHDDFLDDPDDISLTKKKKRKREKTDQLKNLSCDDCEKVLSCRKSLKRHKLRYHPTSQIEVVKNDKSYSERLPK